MEESKTSDRSWSVEEFSGIDFGDDRINARFFKVMEKRGNSPNLSLRQSLGGYADVKAAYRFFANDKVKPAEILQVHRRSIFERALQCKSKQILMIQDTSALTFGMGESIDGLGSMSSSSHYVYGMLTHTALACTVDGIPLGVFDQINWSRNRADGKRHVPLEMTSESERWSRVAELTKKESPKELQVIQVGDREIENFDFFTKSEAIESDYLTRVRTTRVGWINGKRTNLKAYFLSQGTPSGSIEINVPKKKETHLADKRLPRKAIVDIYYSKIDIERPAYGDGPKLIECYSVFAVEQNPAAGVDPIEWMLLTSVPVESHQNALERIAWYGHRWKIETFHKILKSGCKVESTRLGTFERIELYVLLMSVVAWRIQWMKMLNRSNPELPAESLFESTEIEALYAKTFKKLKPQNYSMTIGEAIVLIAKLGGFLGRKSDGPPGSTVLWRGYTRFFTVVEDFIDFRQLATSGD